MAENTAKDQTVAPAPESFLNADGTFKEEQPKNTVRFLGTHLATVRTIAPNEWQTPDRRPLDEGDIKDKENTVSWNLDNKYTLPKGDFSAKQLEVLEADGMFSIT